jgi:integrase
MPIGNDVQGTPLADALTTWAALQGIGKKQSTRDYHQEILGLVTRHWPADLSADVATVSDRTVTDFVLRVAHFSASRFNAIVSVIRATIPAAKKVKRRPVRCKERVILSPAELGALVLELDRRPRSHGGLVVRFLVNTGLRINEARQLRWCHVHLDRIVAPGSVTKNGLPRTIPFVAGTRETLGALRRVGDGVKVLPQSEVQTALRRACSVLGLPRLSHHDFRHMFATRCIQSGVDIPTVARWLGHTDGGALLQRLYFHLVEAHSQAMAAKVKPATPGELRPATWPVWPEFWRN